MQEASWKRYQSKQNTYHSYGKNIQKFPYGENSTDDITMLDTLKKIVNNQDFSVQIVKSLAEKILEHVDKRFMLIQTIKVDFLYIEN